MLAFVSGIGLTLMMVALGIGVIEGNAANDSLITGLFVGGLLALITGLLAWFFYAQPHKHFDDINEPHYHGHDHHDDAEHTDEAAHE